MMIERRIAVFGAYPALATKPFECNGLERGGLKASIAAMGEKPFRIAVPMA